MNKIKFGAYIKESRVKKNYTQKELADLLFIDVSAVSKWERGVSYPDITLVPDICRVLEISEHELIASSIDEDYRKMKTDAKKYNNMRKGTFWTLNICYAIAILVCFIVNITISHRLSWFYIVLTSILCAYSFCPTITWLFTKYKNLTFISSTFISLFLLFLTCSVYTHNYWFMIATIGVLLVYFIIFYPFLFKNIKYKMNGTLSKCFLLSYVLGMFILTVLLLISIYLYVSYNLGIALIITGGMFMLPLALGLLNLFEIGKTLNKPILLSLVGILVVLILMGLGRSIYLKSTEVTKTYIIENIYKDVKIVGNNFDINIYVSNNNENKAVYIENKKVDVELKVVNGTLNINQVDNRKFYDMLFSFSDFKVDLYLTQGVINSLNIDNNTGDIDIKEGFIFNVVNIKNSTGDIEFNSNVTGGLNIKNSTGDIEMKSSELGDINIQTKTGDIEMSNVKCNKLDIKVGTGDTELRNVLVSTDLNVNGSTGDMEFEEIDASNIYIALITGDVEGTLLSSKIFNARSETGRVMVPETYKGGICKITTSTGNIKISYK